jgi:hypothetical protein
MQNIIDSLLQRLAPIVSSLGRFAKAIVPASLGVAEVLANLIFTGSLDSTDLAPAISALVLAVVVYFVPNSQPRAAKRSRK